VVGGNSAADFIFDRDEQGECCDGLGVAEALQITVCSHADAKHIPMTKSNTSAGPLDVVNPLTSSLLQSIQTLRKQEPLQLLQK